MANQVLRTLPTALLRSHAKLSIPACRSILPTATVCSSLHTSQTLRKKELEEDDPLYEYKVSIFEKASEIQSESHEIVCHEPSKFSVTVVDAYKHQMHCLL